MLHLTRLCCAAAAVGAEPVVKVSQKDAVVTLTFNRAKQLNALNREMANAIAEALFKYDDDPSCSVLVVTGEGRAFMAGGDIKTMLDRTFVDSLNHDHLAPLRKMRAIRKPIIAAVNGLALGGGCELAMMCDIVVASEIAKFGQPEINIGTIPGVGGTQYLARAIGRAKAMEWTLTGWHYSAAEAERAGLVSRVVQHDELMPTTLKIAGAIAKHSQLTTQLVKRAVNMADESTLSQGLAYEEFIFHSTFATRDRKEGMHAFAEKRPPQFTNE